MCPSSEMLKDPEVILARADMQSLLLGSYRDNGKENGNYYIIIRYMVVSQNKGDPKIDPQIL